METATVLPIVLEEGIPFGIDLTILDDLDQPVNLTGFRFLLEARESYSSKTSFIHLSTENFGITVDIPTAKVVVFFNGQVSKSKKSGIYDLIGFSPSNVPFKILKGTLQITQTVSIWADNITP